MSAPSDAPPAVSGDRTRRIALRLGLILVVLMTIPVVALFVMEGSVIAGCTTVSTKQGVAEGNVAWRIQAMRCRASETLYYDVAMGAKDKTLATALTSFGSPVPLGVIRRPDGAIAVTLDKPWPAPDSETNVPIRLRRSGSPAERIDLQALERPGGPSTSTAGPRKRM